MGLLVAVSPAGSRSSGRGGKAKEGVTMMLVGVGEEGVAASSSIFPSMVGEGGSGETAPLKRPPC